VVEATATHGVVVEEHRTHERAASCALNSHLVPGVALDTLLQKLKFENSFLGFFSNFFADLLFFLVVTSFTVQVNDEFSTVKLFEVSDVLVLIEEVGKALSDLRDLAD